MNQKNFSEAMNEIDDKYVNEAVLYRKEKAKKHLWFKWSAAAACVCVMAAGGAIFLLNLGNDVPASYHAPNPSSVQVVNPIIGVNSAAEMESYLDFAVPVLDKEVDSYSVIVMDTYPTTGQVDYADGSQFRIQYGSGDISGIYGGSLEETKNIDGIEAKYYKYDTTCYAVWECNGFTFSYVFGGEGDKDSKSLIEKCKNVFE